MAIREVGFRSGHTLTALELNKLLNTIITHINLSEKQMMSLVALHQGQGDLMVVTPQIRTITHPYTHQGEEITVYKLPDTMSTTIQDYALLVFRNTVLLSDEIDYLINLDDNQIVFKESLYHNDHLYIVKVYGAFDKMSVLESYVKKERWNDLISYLRINNQIDEEMYNLLRM